MTSAQWIFVIIGVLIIAIGLAMLIFNFGSTDQGDSKFLGIQVKGPVGLPVMVLGVVLTVLPFVIPGLKPAPETPTPSAATTPPTVVLHQTCLDALELETLKPNTRYRVKDKVGVFGTDNWVGDSRQVWVFLTGPDGNVYTYGKPSDRSVADDGVRHLWASWGAVIGAPGEWTINVRLLSKSDSDSVAAKAPDNGYKVPIPAGAEFVADILVLQDC